MRTPSYDLRPSLRKGSWSAEEDRKLVNYISTYGISNWCKMSSYAGRSDNEIKNHWHTHLKKRINYPLSITEPEEITKSSDLDDDESSVESSVEPADCFFSSTVSNGHTSSSCIFDMSSRSYHEQQEVKLETGYNYDISSPGTIQDIKSFWEQLYYANYD
ncbi:Homeodomain-like protein [Cynara cardunculus var. scolymus]|uniref:Homeodomain-like protein n=1 Tax=Cynara cardunculus var. scolymus TaxID=59895 RepID=A0A118K4M2_CYNCS|nr:Homeodomain-like protein [Cynara cardunculus var. scolymus]